MCDIRNHLILHTICRETSFIYDFCLCIFYYFKFAVLQWAFGGGPQQAVVDLGVASWPDEQPERVPGMYVIRCPAPAESQKGKRSFTPIKSWDVNVVFVFYEFDLVWITPVKCSVCIWFIAFYIKKIFINTSGDNRMVLSANRRNRSQEASPGVKEKATAAT